MGGSGGGFFQGLPSRDIKDLLEEAASRTRNESYEGEIANKLNQLLVEYNSRDSEKINSYLDVIKRLLEQDIEGSIYLKFGGSVLKHTYVDGLSDVDCLVLLKDQALANLSPREVLDYFKKELRAKLEGYKEIEAGNMAVTISYPDNTIIQLLPAIRKGPGFVIPSSRRANQWSQIIRPEKFADYLTRVNQRCSGKLVPTIKLVKGTLAKLLGEHVLSGYHIESLAIEVFKTYEGSTTLKAMVERFFDRAKDLVKKPIKDRTGQSLHVDDYLGTDHSTERYGISEEFDRISRTMRNANRASLITDWLAAIGE